MATNAKGAAAAVAWGPGSGEQLTEGVFTAISLWRGEKELRFPRILAVAWGPGGGEQLAEGVFTAIRQCRFPAAGRRAALRLLVVVLLLLLPAGPLAQAAGNRLSAAAAGHPDPEANCQCPAAKPGIWALVVILGIVAALSDGYILHSELALRRARKAAKARARERSLAAANGAGAWGYPPTAPPMPRQGI